MSSTADNLSFAHRLELFGDAIALRLLSNTLNIVGRLTRFLNIQGKRLQLDALPVLSNGKADYPSLLLLATEISHAD